MTTKAEIGAMWPQAKGCLEPPEAGRDKALVLRGLGGDMAPDDTLTLDFWLPELWEKQFLLFKATPFVSLITAATGNKHTSFLFFSLEFFFFTEL